MARPRKALFDIKHRNNPNEREQKIAPQTGLRGDLDQSGLTRLNTVREKPPTTMPSSRASIRASKLFCLLIDFSLLILFLLMGTFLSLFRPNFGKEPILRYSILYFSPLLTSVGVAPNRFNPTMEARIFDYMSEKYTIYRNNF